MGFFDAIRKFNAMTYCMHDIVGCIETKDGKKICKMCGKDVTEKLNKESKSFWTKRWDEF